MRIRDFLDPEIYTPGKPLTAVGYLGGVEFGSVGERPYRFPLLEADSYRLWPQARPPRVVYYYDPWFVRPPLTVVPRFYFGF